MAKFTNHFGEGRLLEKSFTSLVMLTSPVVLTYFVMLGLSLKNYSKNEFILQNLNFHGFLRNQILMLHIKKVKENKNRQTTKTTTKLLLSKYLEIQKIRELRFLVTDSGF